MLHGTAVSAAALSDGWAVTNAEAQVFTCRRLLLTAGLKDELPPITGFAACWGITAVHCPYCHGYEIRHQPTGILANGDAAFHYVQMVSQLTSQLTVFTNGPADFTEQQRTQLRQKNILVIEKEILEIIHQQGLIQKLVLEDGNEMLVKALYARPAFQQHCTIPAQLGCAVTPQGLLTVDAFFKTTVPGVYAAGDCASPMRSVAVAVASGMSAAAFINKELIEEAFAL